MPPCRPDLTPGLDPLTSPTGQIYYYTLESDTKGLRELSEIQRWIIIPALKQVPGVADVQNFGGITTQFQLELDPAAARALQPVARQYRSRHQRQQHQRRRQRRGARRTRLSWSAASASCRRSTTSAPSSSRSATARRSSLRDLGKLKLANQERHGILGKNRKNDAIEGTVLLLRGDNPSRVIDGVHAKVAELNERLKRDDVQIVPYIDRADLVDATVDKVSHTIFQGDRPRLHRPHPVPRQSRAAP